MSDHNNERYSLPAKLYHRDGIARYCAPWCGMHCTLQSYQSAVAAAAALATRLGKGWEANVWENLGWHYSVVKGQMAVHPRDRETNRVRIGYTAYLNTTKQFVESGNTPEEAIAAALTAARQFVNHMIIDLNSFIGEEALRVS